jgi:hypothetical protein
MNLDLDRESLIREALLSSYRSLTGYVPGNLPSSVVFVPTRRLYDAYLKWLSQNVEHAEPVGERMFGRFLGSALGVDAELRVQRFVKGRREWGYLGIQGPGSITVTTQRGRRAKPPEDAHETAAPAAEV